MARHENNNCLNNFLLKASWNIFSWVYFKYLASMELLSSTIACTLLTLCWFCFPFPCCWLLLLSLSVDCCQDITSSHSLDSLNWIRSYQPVSGGMSSFTLVWPAGGKKRSVALIFMTVSSLSGRLICDCKWQTHQL